MQTFNPSSSMSLRAVQAWQILVHVAAERRTITYESLAYIMFERPAQGVLNRILGHIAFYCKDEGLPMLTVLVVNKDTGRPGNNIPLDRMPESVDTERERVYDEHWFNIVPPTVDDLRAAYAAGADHFQSAT